MARRRYRYEEVPQAWLKVGDRFVYGIPVSQTLHDGEPYVGDQLDEDDEPLYRRVDVTPEEEDR